jgi:hypothetical protein
MAYHRLYHGGMGVNNVNYQMYPEAPLVAGDPLAPAAHKEAITFGLTRLLDFSQLDARRQAGLQQYLETLTALGTPLKQSDVIGMSIVPAKSLFYGFAWEVEKPQSGVTLTVKMHTGGQTITVINASTAASDGHASAARPCTATCSATTRCTTSRTSLRRRQARRAGTRPR